ncbi:MAG TPA: ABC transporter permease subunit, partial [Burkholderiaceae bacterium]|nr:ABC transporter permease subunit [Burkholderiaceae bacterium]
RSDAMIVAPCSMRTLAATALPPLSVVIVALLIWQYLIPLGIVPGVRAEYLGTPSGVWEAATELARRGYGGHDLFDHVRASVFRTVTGFTVAACIGVPLGIVLGHNRRAGAFLLPIFGFLRPIPALAFVPIVVIWFGIGEFAKIFVIFMTAFLYVLLGSVSGVRSVPADYFRLGRNYHLSTASTLFRVVLPAALPEIFVSLRTAMALSWAVVVASELIAAQVGLGFLIQSASQVYAINKVYVGVALIGLVGVAIDMLFLIIERRLLHWVGR